VQVSVVADEALRSRFNSTELSRYVLTVMNQVAVLYKVGVGLFVCECANFSAHAAHALTVANRVLCLPLMW
jgi:hypothetical protein